jgi:hypothetical protein
MPHRDMAGEAQRGRVATGWPGSVTASHPPWYAHTDMCRWRIVGKRPSSTAAAFWPARDRGMAIAGGVRHEFWLASGADGAGMTNE